MTDQVRKVARILVSIEITDPETVDAYKDVDDVLIFEDLRDGSLMQKATLVLVSRLLPVSGSKKQGG